MPIALIPELTAALWRTGRVLSPWTHLAEVETQLLRRAESAFVSRWFGPAVPERRLSLYIAIRNIDALREQYLRVKESTPRPPPGLNLLGPFSGIAGLITGLAMSPTGLILIASQMGRILTALSGASWKIYLALFAALVPGLAPAVAVGVGLPAALAGALALSAGGNSGMQTMVALGGEIGVLLDALVRFWDQLSGKEPIRNPLLRRILETLDRFANLFVQVLGFAGFILVRLAPLVPNLVGQFRVLMELLETAMATLKDILTGFVLAIKEPFTGSPGLMTVLDSVLDILLDLPNRLIEPVRALIADTAAEMALVFTAISAKLSDYATGVQDRFQAAFKLFALGALVERIKALLELMPQVAEAFRNAPEPEKESSDLQETLRSRKLDWATGGIFGPGITTRVAEILVDIDKITLPPKPELPDLAAPGELKIPGLRDLAKRMGTPKTPDFADLAKQLFADARAAQAKAPVPAELLRTPRSAFVAERLALAAAKKTPPVPDLGDEKLRDLIYVAVGRVLPPALRVYAPDVRDMFDLIDEKIYRNPPGPDAEAARLPMEDLDDDGTLRPVIGTLRFVAPGGEMPDLRAFRNSVVKKVLKQTYRATAPG